MAFFLPLSTQSKLKVKYRSTIKDKEKKTLSWIDKRMTREIVFYWLPKSKPNVPQSFSIIDFCLLYFHEKCLFFYFFPHPDDVILSWEKLFFFDCYSWMLCVCVLFLKNRFVEIGDNNFLFICSNNRYYFPIVVMTYSTPSIFLFSLYIDYRIYFFLFQLFLNKKFLNIFWIWKVINFRFFHR